MNPRILFLLDMSADWLEGGKDSGSLKVRAFPLPVKTLLYWEVKMVQSFIGDLE